MLAVLRRNPLALGLAVLLHLGLAVFLVIEFDWRDPVEPIGGNVEVVQARLVDQRQLDAASAAREAEAEAARRAERQAALERQRAEDARRAEEQRRAEAERQRQAAERKRREEQAERQRLAELERQRKAEEQERERKAEEERKRKAEEERRRKAEEERRRKAEQEREREAEQERRRKAEAEEKARAAAEARAEAERAAREAELAARIAAEQDASELARVVGLIKAKIERNWLRPPGTAGLTCEVRVRLGPNGSVLLASVSKSSGSASFDRSVESAVRKADPLPMPNSPRLRERFRDLTFIFDPGG